MASAISALNNAIIAYNAGGGSISAIQAASRAKTQAQKDYVSACNWLSLAQLELSSIEKEIELLQQDLEEIDIENVWCADLTENLADDLDKELATIEVPGERVENRIYIHPAYDNGADFDPDRDGQLQPVYGNTGAATFYNGAMLPGWQRWKPQYRAGRIVYMAPDKSSCTVKIYKAFSSAQNLKVNPPSNILNNVPFNYMNCNGAAFSKGDEVIIEFSDRDWENPQVMGFMHDPKGCQFYIKIKLNGTLPGANYQVKLLYSDGTWSPARTTNSESIAGPFDRVGTSAYPYLYYKRGSSKIFEYFQTVGVDDDWDYAGYLREEAGDCDVSEICNAQPCYGEGEISGYTRVHGYWSTIDPGPDESPTYYKQIEWKKQNANVYDQSYEVGDGGPIFDIGFTQLYNIQLTTAGSFPLIYWHIPECGWDEDMQPPITVDFWNNHIPGRLSDPCTVYEYGSGYFSYEGETYAGYIEYVPILNSITIGNQVITTNEDGLNPTFSPTEYNLGTVVVYEHVVKDPDGNADDVCLWEDHVTYSSTGYDRYSMVEKEF